MFNSDVKCLWKRCYYKSLRLCSFRIRIIFVRFGYRIRFIFGGFVGIREYRRSRDSSRRLIILIVIVKVLYDSGVGGFRLVVIGVLF